jgi:hypothetical protein
LLSESLRNLLDLPEKLKKNKTESTESQPSKNAECTIDIQIESQGDVNIYNCSAPPSRGEPGQPPKDDHVCPPVAYGACVPVSLGFKPKQSRRHKLDQLLANTRVPSVLGASFFHMLRRYLAGKAAGHILEERTFAMLRRLSPELQRVMACTLDSFDSLSSGERNRLFDSDLLGDVDQPDTITKIREAFTEEILENIGVQVFDDPRCGTEENPGKVRTPPFPGGEFPPNPVVICRINGLRTIVYRPPLSEGDLTPDEVQQICHVVIENNQPKQVCEVQRDNCPDGKIGSVCMRMQQVEAGETVLLEGVNFSSLDTKVRVSDLSVTIVREVDAHVCGDDETPLTEVVNGTNQLITDCRVHDRLTFRMPEDLPSGRYQLQVLVPNEVPGWGPLLQSDGVVIDVIPSSTSRFQIASETLRCHEETSPASFGSDEVGIKIIAVPLFLDLTAGEVQEPNGGEPIRFGNVDSGNERGMDHLLFSHQQPIVGVALSIRGFEVDGEEAFEREIEDWTEIFVDILKDQLKIALENLATVQKIVEMIGYFYAAIAALVVLAIDLFVALWAPADPIIEDIIGPTVDDLVQLTSTNFPMPLPSEHVTPQGIKVKVTPLEKVPGQYREKREYISDDEESRYEIVLRYNLLT